MRRPLCFCDGLCSGDPVDEVILFATRFGAYGEGVKDSGAESVADGFCGAVAEVSLAEDLHADDAFAVGAHLPDDFDDGVGVGVHVRADGVEADEIDVDPWRCGRGTKSFDGVAGDSVGADGALVFRFAQHVHDTAVAGGPVADDGAVDEDDVDVVDAEFAAETLEVAGDAGGVAGVGLGHDDDLVSRELPDGSGDVGVASVRVGCVEEAEAVVVVAVEEQTRERVCAEACLVGGASEADGAGSHGETRGADPGAAEDDLVLCLVALGESVKDEGGGRGSFCG